MTRTSIELVGGKLDGLRFDVPCPTRSLFVQGQWYQRASLQQLVEAFLTGSGLEVVYHPIPYRLMDEQHAQGS